MDLANEIIGAVRQEIDRLEDVRNRPRSFIFGLTGGEATPQGLTAVYLNAPERVRREAEFHGHAKDLVFRLGEAFVSGRMEAVDRGVALVFTADELKRHGLDPEEAAGFARTGIEYVSDPRNLLENLEEFLLDNLEEHLDLVGELLGGPNRDQAVLRAPLAITGDLNDSQRAAVELALGRRVTYVWGPPGTGKTKTLGALAANLVAAGRRVLLAATSNAATDQLFLDAWEWIEREGLAVTAARTGRPALRDLDAFTDGGYGKPGFKGGHTARLFREHAQRAKLVGATFARLPFTSRAPLGEFDWVIADEGSMANLPDLAAACCYATAGIVVGGDPHQLPPVFPEDAETPNAYFSQHVFERAGIGERALDDGAGGRAAFLDTQYRMQEEIGSLVSHMFYAGKLKTGTLPVGPLPGFPGRIVFVDAAGEDERPAGGEGRVNRAHAIAVGRAVRALLDAGVAAREIGVIAPYNAQVSLIDRELRSAGHGRSIRVSTVHAFQGDERRAMVVDFTDESGRPTHLTAKRSLINVALSRAREQLIVVGNAEYLRHPRYFEEEELAMFAKLLDAAEVRSERRTRESAGD